MTEASIQKGEVQVNRYDAEGLRHEKEENGRLVQFLYKGKEVVAEEGEKAGVVRYIRRLGLVSSDSEEARTYYHYASDELGSITHIVKAAVHKKLGKDGQADGGEKDKNNDCQVLNRYAYDAFGNRVECEEQVENRFGFAGELYDPVSALVYLRARFYNPVIGRFLQEDNVYEDGLNLYVYCRNNPVRYVDPSGHGTESPADKNGGGKEDHSGDIEALKELVDEVNAKGGATPDEAAILKKWADDCGVDYDSLGVKEKGNGGSATIQSQIQDIKSKTPQQLLKDGWQDVTDPRMAANTTSKELYNPETGLRIRFDQGVEGASGFEAVDHYHIYNSDYTNKKVDYYFDIDGTPVGKGSKASHIVIGGKD